MAMIEREFPSPFEKFESPFPDISFTNTISTSDYSDYFDFMAGMAGGCAGLAFGYPFDTLKVIQQTGSGNTSLMTCVKTTLKADGVRGLFRGMAFPLVSVGALNAVFFGVYGNTIRRLSPDPDNPNYLHISLAGAFAGAIQAVPACPVELVKVQMQAHSGNAAFRNPMECISHIYRTKGLQGCFRGLGPTIMREVPGFGVYVSSYEYICSLLTRGGSVEDLGVGSLLMAGGTAGMLSWMLNIPIDIVKSRIQADCMEKPKYKGFADCALKSYKAEGYRVFWRGLPITCMRAFPTNAVTFAVYSISLQALNNNRRHKDGVERGRGWDGMQ